MTRRASLYVLLAVAVLASPAALAAESNRPVRVTSSVNATRDDVDPHRTYGTPVIAVDPENPKHVVAATTEIRSRTCGFLRSTDGGRTWARPEVSPTLDAYPFCFQTETGPAQAVVAFGRNGTLYYAYAGWDTSDSLSDWPIGQGGGWRGNVSVIVSRSSDLGDSWQTTIARNARGLEGDAQENNRPVSTLVVDTRSGPEDIVYVGWLATRRDRNRPMMALSRDAGRTFSDPIDLTGGYFEDESVRQGLARAARVERTPAVAAVDFSWPDFTLDGDGNLYSVWAARIQRGPQLDNSGTYLSRSTDGGRSFVAREISPIPEVLYYPVLAWTGDGGPRGTLHLVYEKEGVPGARWVQDIFHRRSTDRGDTWSEPVTLNDDGRPEDLIGQFHPSVAVAPNGRIDVAWWDFRNDSGNFANDVYLTSSGDHGASWSPNVRVTDQSIRRRIGVWYGNADIRQAPGIAASDAFTVLAWDDTRNGDETNESQDVYSGVVQFEALPPTTPVAAQYGLAAASGVAGFGIILLLLSVARKRREPAPFGADRRTGERVGTP
ncbi:MAG: glycoside hydrolase [Actinomycetota bacterium]|nr:glycoside hydrolase [Actinomycetota bacterium]